jgi:hypothetical protein
MVYRVDDLPQNRFGKLDRQEASAVAKRLADIPAS